MLDSLGLLDAALAQPERVAALAAALPATRSPAADGIGSVLLLGSGANGDAADAVATLAAREARLPVLPPQSELPAFVGPGTAVVALSFSGDDADTLAGARAAVDAGAHLVAVTSGGAIAELAGSGGGSMVRLDATAPTARSAYAELVVAGLCALAGLGVVEDPSGEVDTAVEQLRRRRDELASDRDPSAVLARRIGRTFPIVYGGGPPGAVSARRWKSLFNEGPKVPAFAGALPDVTHAEISGWAQHGDVTRQVFTLVLLRHSHEPERTARALELVGEICEEVVAAVHTVRASGDGLLAQLLDLSLVGELVALHLAANEGVDPGPVPMADDLACTLARQ